MKNGAQIVAQYDVTPAIFPVIGSALDTDGNQSRGRHASDHGKQQILECKNAQQLIQQVIPQETCCKEAKKNEKQTGKNTK